MTAEVISHFLFYLAILLNRVNYEKINDSMSIEMIDYK